jgi:ribosome-associated translation inhibitor RaiA
MNVDVTVRGEVSEEAVREARDRIAALEHFAHAPVLGAHVILTEERNPRLARPSRAEGEINLNGRVMHGRVAAEAMPLAIDQLAEHLQRQLGRFVARRERLSRRPRPDAPQGTWRHGDWSPPRPGFYPRTPEERSLVRRKTFAVGAINPIEAVAELHDLDHAFYLFHDLETDADAVVYRRDDGRIGLIHPADVSPRGYEGPIREASRVSEPITVEAAVAEMNVLDHRFLFFVNGDSGRGNVIYLRYDGNYGLIEPAD